MEPVIKKLLRTLENVMEHVEKVRLPTHHPLTHHLPTHHLLTHPLLTHPLLTTHPLTNHPLTNYPLTNHPLTNHPLPNRPRTDPPPTLHQAGVGSTDPGILRLLQDVVASAPRMPAVQFNQMFNSQVS